MTEPTFENAAVPLLNQPPPPPAVHAPGTVAALAGEAGRYTRFAIAMQALGFRLPPGTAVKWLLGSDIAESRNQACEEIDGEWIWFIDDDHTFRDDVLLKLLDRDVDIVTPFCLRRTQPFLPVPAVDGDFLDVRRYGPTDLIESDHAGSSGMLIRKHVLDAMGGPPWFELGDREGDYGNRVSEDVTFCRRAKAAGFKVHVDLGVRLGHLTTAIVWPVWSVEEDRWLTGFTVADGAQLATEPAEIPAASAPDEPVPDE